MRGVVLAAVMVMMAAVGRIAAVVMVDLLATVSRKQLQHLHRVVQRAFVQPEAERSPNIGHQQKRRQYFACE